MTTGKVTKSKFGEEYEKNKALGEKKGLWKYGLLLDESYGDLCLPEEENKSDASKFLVEQCIANGLRLEERKKGT